MTKKRYNSYKELSEAEEKESYTALEELAGGDE